MYTKTIDGIKVTAPRVLVVDGMQIINPTADQYLQEGYTWEEPIEEPIVETPSLEERMDAAEGSIAMITDCVLEMSTQVYS